LELLKVYATVKRSLEEQPSDFLENYVDGASTKRNRALFSDVDILVPLSIYNGDFGVDNVLRGLNAKQGGTYVTLPSLPPEYQSYIENVIRVALSDSEARKDFGNES